MRIVRVLNPQHLDSIVCQIIYCWQVSPSRLVPVVYLEHEVAKRLFRSVKQQTCVYKHQGRPYHRIDIFQSQCSAVCVGLVGASFLSDCMPRAIWTH